MILVTGATGKVGRSLVSQLNDAGVAVRALARTPETADLPDGVEVAQGDLSTPDTLDKALDGVDSVFLVWPGLPAEFAPPVLDVVGGHARRLVYLSSHGVPDDDVERETDPITGFHTAVERAVQRTGLEWTFLRAGGFASNTLGWAAQIRADGVVRWPYGEAGRSLIHEQDIAAVAVRALTDDGHAGAKHHLTGPQTLTQVEQVRVIGEVIGRPLRWEEVAPEAARERMLAEGWPPAFVDGALDAWAGMVTRPEAVSPAVEEITGAPARTFREWVTDHAASFR
ncbi:NAD(P)H-binding protein [Streptosporangium carneum]|uniref:Nucleotide-diphosphate-sugar epimerase n=1 Tax=Streptosporangium carneum TaxID=47481 RepID=A0A9W6MAP8_9ACTN|nr:NAD(P)H-binding protein [Streptosporangium carneum]GLK07539.1 nucleotide-diphosphate-sugar epimerase [Streptosporangium carneum]